MRIGQFADLRGEGGGLTMKKGGVFKVGIPQCILCFLCRRMQIIDVPLYCLVEKKVI